MMRYKTIVAVTAGDIIGAHARVDLHSKHCPSETDSPAPKREFRPNEAGVESRRKKPSVLWEGDSDSKGTVTVIDS
jgi:hypothetical protein